MNNVVTIITTTFQECDHLRIVADGIKNQDYDKIEYIIIDGNSQDGTKEFLEELSQTFPDGSGRTFRYLSEPDEGIYDAINKGIRLASGDIIGFMFDHFCRTDAVSIMVKEFETKQVDGVHSDLNYIGEDGKIVRKWRMREGKLKYGWMPGHPTLYLRKAVYEEFGLYKTQYRIAADYEFMVRILQDSAITLAYIPEVLVEMFYGGTSTNGLKSYKDSFLESYSALRDNKVKGAFLICCLRTIRVMWQFIK